MEFVWGDEISSTLVPGFLIEIEAEKRARGGRDKGILLARTLVSENGPWFYPALPWVPFKCEPWPHQR